MGAHALGRGRRGLAGACSNGEGGCQADSEGHEGQRIRQPVGGGEGEGIGGDDADDGFEQEYDAPHDGDVALGGAEGRVFPQSVPVGDAFLCAVGAKALAKVEGKGLSKGQAAEEEQANNAGNNAALNQQEALIGATDQRGQRCSNVEGKDQRRNPRKRLLAHMLDDAADKGADASGQVGIDVVVGCGIDDLEEQDGQADVEDAEDEEVEQAWIETHAT